MKKSKSIPDFKKIYNLKKRSDKHEIYIMRSFSQGINKKKTLFMFFKVNQFTNKNIFELRAREYFDFNNFIKTFTNILQKFDKRIKNYYIKTKFMKIDEKILKFRLLAFKNKKVNYLKMCLSNCYNDLKPYITKPDFRKRLKFYFLTKSQNLLEKQYECKICNRLIYSLLFEDHIKNCYDINLSKEELKKYNGEILNMCEEIEKKEKEKFLKKMKNTKLKDKKKVDIFFRKTFYEKNKKRNSDVDKNSSFFGSIKEPVFGSTILPLKESNSRKNFGIKSKNKKKTNRNSITLISKKKKGYKNINKNLNKKKIEGYKKFQNSESEDEIFGLKKKVTKEIIEFPSDSDSKNDVFKIKKNKKDKIYNLDDKFVDSDDDSVKKLNLVDSDEDSVKKFSRFEENEKLKNEIKIENNKKNLNLGDKFGDDSESMSEDSGSMSEYDVFGRNNKKSESEKSNINIGENIIKNLKRKKTNSFKEIKNDEIFIKCGIEPSFKMQKQMAEKKKLNLGDKFGSETSKKKENKLEEKINTQSTSANRKGILCHKFGSETRRNRKKKKSSKFGSETSFSKTVSKLSDKKQGNLGNKFNSETSKSRISKKKTNLGDKFESESSVSKKSKIKKSKSGNLGDKFRSNTSNSKSISKNKKTNLGDKFESETSLSKNEKSGNLGDKFRSETSNSKLSEIKIIITKNLGDKFGSETSLSKSSKNKKTGNLGDKFGSDTSLSKSKSPNKKKETNLGDKFGSDTSLSKSIKNKKTGNLGDKFGSISSNTISENSNNQLNQFKDFSDDVISEDEKNDVFGLGKKDSFRSMNKNKKVKPIKKNILLPKKMSRFQKDNIFFDKSDKSSSNNNSKNSKDRISPLNIKSFKTGFGKEIYNPLSSIKNVSSINNLNSLQLNNKYSTSLNSKEKLIKSKKINSLKLDLRFGSEKTKKLSDSTRFENKEEEEKKNAKKQNIWKRMKQSTTDYRKNMVKMGTEETILYYSLIKDIKYYKSKLLNHPYQKNLIYDQRLHTNIKNKITLFKDKDKKKFLNKICELIEKRIKHVKIIIKNKNNVDDIYNLKKNKIKKQKCQSFAEYSCLSILSNSSASGSLEKDLRGATSNIKKKKKIEKH